MSFDAYLQMVDAERKKAAKAAAEASDALDAEKARSRDALRILQQQMQARGISATKRFA